MVRYTCEVNPDDCGTDEVKMGRKPGQHVVFITAPLEERLGDIPKLKQEKRFSYRVGETLARYFALCDSYKSTIYERFMAADLVALREIVLRYCDTDIPIDQIEHSIARALLAADMPDRAHQQSLFDRVTTLTMAEQVALLEILTHPDRL